MTKPGKPQRGKNQKASKGQEPAAPFAWNREKPPAHARPGAGGRGGQAAPKAPIAKVERQERSGSAVRLSSQSGPDQFTPNPGAIVNRRAADRLRAGSLWVYASDIETIHLPGSGLPDGGEPARLLPVADARGLLLGTALYSPASQIALRLVSREAIDEAAWLELLAARLRAAIIRRAQMLRQGSDSLRLCFSEADELPGLVIDRYGDLAVVQLLAKGLDSPAVREVCVRVLREEVCARVMREERPLAAIWERPDPRIRELEGLAAPEPGPLWALDSNTPATATQFRLNGIAFQYDVNSGQKTGAFLDQTANYDAARKWASLLTPGGRALDVCCYQGGFALHLAKVSRRVTGIDASRAALEVAERNLEANRDQISAEVDWVAGDAFEILRDWSDAGEKFDTIVLDPPAFAKSKRAVEGALRGYKELNLRALKMLRPGGLLVTCTCSHHVGWADFEAAVASAAADAGRRARLHERRGAAPDHPVVLNLAETEYLKCLVLEAE